MEPQLSDIKELRELTSAGIMDCKSALIEANGDIEQAKVILHEKGLASVAKKSSRATEEGVVASYIHAGGRIGSIVEVNCETDFVARTDDFKLLHMTLRCRLLLCLPNLSIWMMNQMMVKNLMKIHAWWNKILLKTKALK